MKILYLIPARGGSKGIPGKNIKHLSGKPLIYYAIDSAREIANDIDICLSSDDPEIIDLAEKHGLKVPFARPSSLSTDTASKEGLIHHAVDFYAKNGTFYDLVVVLQPTSPLRNSNHIKEAVGLFNSELDMVVSVYETKSNPYFVLFEEDKNGYLNQSKKGDFHRRQDCPKVWEYNGAIFAINTRSLNSKKYSSFTKIVKYEMDEISSVDIDTSLDWSFAEYLLNKRVNVLKD